MAGLTATAEDYLKATWSATEWNGEPASTSSLADRFGITRATASATIKRLAEQGLLIHEPYGAIQLTGVGERHAVAMVRRHRLIETFLVSQLGYDWSEVHDEAERLEHAASDLMVERIDALLGHPQADPHGDPIPSPSGVVTYPTDALALADAGPGEYTVLRISDRDPEPLRTLGAWGLRPGSRLRVGTGSDRAPTVDVADGRSMSLEPQAAAAVIVRPGRH